MYYSYHPNITNAMTRNDAQCQITIMHIFMQLRNTLDWTQDAHLPNFIFEPNVSAIQVVKVSAVHSCLLNVFVGTETHTTHNTLKINIWNYWIMSLQSDKCESNCRAKFLFPSEPQPPHSSYTQSQLARQTPTTLLVLRLFFLMVEEETGS
jgi:hypothetical protein